MFEETKRFHRAPISFGPACTPRQDIRTGKPFPNWKTESEMHTTGIVYDCERESLQSLLPEGYTSDPDKQCTVLFEVMNFRKLPWLAGRGYNTWGIYANDVICQRVNPPQRGSYMLVLFESFTDPIVTGREELGFPKVWAELPDPVVDEKGTMIHTASWFGTEFLRMEILQVQDRPTTDAPSQQSRTFGHPAVDGTLHHRYIPAVGEPGKHDASYATYMPGSDRKPQLLYYRNTGAELQDCSVKVLKREWEEIPTLFNIVEGLANLKLGNVREVAVQGIVGASDCGTNRRIEF